MIRKNGKHERATWDEAMNLIVSKAKETREKLTSHGIGFYTSGQLFLEEYYALAMVGKAGLCTLHMLVYISNALYPLNTHTTTGTETLGSVLQLPRHPCESPSEVMVNLEVIPISTTRTAS